MTPQSGHKKNELMDQWQPLNTRAGTDTRLSA